MDLLDAFLRENKYVKDSLFHPSRVLLRRFASVISICNFKAIWDIEHRGMNWMQASVGWSWSKNYIGCYLSYPFKAYPSHACASSLNNYSTNFHGIDLISADFFLARVRQDSRWHQNDDFWDHNRHSKTSHLFRLVEINSPGIVQARV